MKSISCKKEDKKEEEVKVEPFDLKEEYYKESKFIDIDLDTLNTMTDNKESFVLYVYLPGCSSCAAFKEKLDEFHKDNKLVIYSGKIQEVINTELKDKIKYAPSFVVYKEGKIYGYLDSASDKDKPYYESAEEFKEWLTKYINLK